MNQKIIDAVIRKAEKACPDSLALIGIYGSVATGDNYAKSDLGAFAADYLENK